MERESIKLNVAVYFLAAFFLCLLLCSVSFMSEEYMSGAGIFGLFVIIALTLVCVSFAAKKAYNLNNFAFIAALICSFAVSALVCGGVYRSTAKGTYILVAGLCGLMLYVTVTVLTGRMTDKKLVIILFFAGLLLRFAYALYTSVTTRQHDNYGFDSDSGHGGYIKYIYEHNLALPDFDVSTKDQFYHPPLFHFICAAWWKILSMFGVSDAACQSSMKTLTLFYSTSSLILCYLLLEKFNVKKVYLVAAFAIIAFNPTFVIFSASLNNDVLSVTFMLAALYFAFCWREKKSFKNIIFTALAIGLGMNTKTSAYMIAFPVGVIFIYALTENGDFKKDFKKYLPEFAVFLLICAPIGLWWNVKNSIKYNMSIAYVQRLSNDSWQYVGSHSVFERLFDFSPKHFSSVFDQWTNRGEKLYNEYNPLISLLKTSCFGEYINDYSYPAISIWAVILFYSNLILALCGVAAGVYIVVRSVKEKKFEQTEVALLVGYAFMLLNYYVFCFSYPHHCTENIRYVSPLIAYGLLFIGIAGERLEVNLQKNTVKLSIKTALSLIVALYALSSVTMFALIGISG